MKRLLLLCLLAFTAVCHGTGFDQGNDLYAAGKYADAAKAYEAQISRGDYSANLFYNLANADFRLGQRGKAILNYRRALLLDPSHAEAGSNLSFIRGGDLPRSASSAPWAWAAAVAGWVGVVALAAGALSRGRRPMAWALAAAALLTAGGCVAAIRYWTNDDANALAAIVLEDKTRAFYAPADTSSAVTTLPVGDEVHILADRGAWLYTQLPNGARAWIPAAKLERLIPPAGPAK